MVITVYVKTCTPVQQYHGQINSNHIITVTVLSLINLYYMVNPMENSNSRAALWKNILAAI